MTTLEPPPLGVHVARMSSAAARMPASFNAVIIASTS